MKRKFRNSNLWKKIGEKTKFIKWDSIKKLTTNFFNTKYFNRWIMSTKLWIFFKLFYDLKANIFLGHAVRKNGSFGHSKLLSLNDVYLYWEEYGV